MRTNLGLLRRTAAHPAFGAAELDAGFIGRHGVALLPRREPAPSTALAAAVVRVLQDQAEATAAGSYDPFSPWNLSTAWRMNGDGYQDMLLAEGDAVHAVRAHFCPSGPVRHDLPGGAVVAEGDAIDGTRRAAPVVRSGSLLTVILDGTNCSLTPVDPLAPPRAEAEGGNRLLAPMPGRIVDVLMRSGNLVAQGGRADRAGSDEGADAARGAAGGHHGRAPRCATWWTTGRSWSASSSHKPREPCHFRRARENVRPPGRSGVASQGL